MKKNIMTQYNTVEQKKEQQKWRKRYNMKQNEILQQNTTWNNTLSIQYNNAEQNKHRQKRRILYNMTQHETLRQNTTWNKTLSILYNTVEHKKKKEKTIQHDTGWNITTKYNMKQNIIDTIQ